MIKIEENRLDHKSVSRIWATSRDRWFDDSEVDFDGVESCDSSAVAFLVKWGKCCRQRSQRLICHNAPPSLISLIRIYSVDDLMEFRNNG
jgi:ABC-type transporter Mla MlaB component